MTNELNIAILTSGGDAPGMNAIVAGACEEVERLGGRVLGICGGFAGLASRRAEPVTAQRAREHMHEPGTWLGTSRWPQLREPEGRAACREAIEGLGLTGLVVIGGDGSTEGARAMAGPLRVEHDVEVARWVQEALRDDFSVGAVVPPIFDAYARILHPATLDVTTDETDAWGNQRFASREITWAEAAVLIGDRARVGPRCLVLKDIEPDTDLAPTDWRALPGRGVAS